LGKVLADQKWFKDHTAEEGTTSPSAPAATTPAPDPVQTGLMLLDSLFKKQE
jgi:hypothetical protein